MRIYLELRKEWEPAHRARISYAFRLFCAIYGHQPELTSERAPSADIWIRYGSRKTEAPSRPALYLSNLYRARPVHEAAPPPWKFIQEDEETVLFYQPLPGEEPDWLGEIFEWVSCADEYSIEERDPVGRIPFAATYVGRHGLNVRIPYAAVSMRRLNLALCKIVPSMAAKPASPGSSGSHFLVSTHDVDYLPLGRPNAVYRLAKNAVISCLLSKQPKLALRQVAMALRVATGGQDPLDQIPHLAGEERGRGVGASYYFLPRHLARRDANYAAKEPVVQILMRSLQIFGLEVGVHGSYTCLDTSRGLSEEYEIFRQAGFRPRGGRQHWLRFTLDRLIPALEKAGAVYDTSIGWSDRIGFRAGACFAFPPYNFDEERAATFLEIPLAIMDQGLQEESNREEDWYSKAADLLSASRRYAWGGISLLWHPAAFGGGWLSPVIGEIFWHLMDDAGRNGDTWVSARSFVRAVHERYVEVGLLSGSAPHGMATQPLHQPLELETVRD
jgi:hypothetical protein